MTTARVESGNRAELVDQFRLRNRKMKKNKTRATKECKCLRCAKSSREKFDGKTWLICGDEACDMKCAVCTSRPSSDCGFKELEDEVREEVTVCV